MEMSNFFVLVKKKTKKKTAIRIINPHNWNGFENVLYLLIQSAVQSPECAS